LDKILEKEHNLSRETLLYAAGLMRNGIIELLKGGKAVDLLEMGILYIKPKSGMVKNCPSITDIPDMILSFSPSDLALEAVKDIVIGENVTNLKNPVIEEIFDVHTNEISDKISAGHSIQLLGSRLKVAGSKDDIGFFLLLVMKLEPIAVTIQNGFALEQKESLIILFLYLCLNCRILLLLVHIAL